MLSVDMRQRLANLGHPAGSNETNRENLQFIANRLTADLNNYRSIANHWQQQYIDLTQPKSPKSSPSSHAQASNDSGENFELLNWVSSSSTSDISLFDTEFFGALNSIANPTLSLFDIGPPKLYSNVSSLTSIATFRSVMLAVNLMASLDNLPELAENMLPPIDHLKPEFDTSKAFRIWNDIFEPMNFQPPSLTFNASPSCRRIADDLEDADMDHLDRVLAQASDKELVDLLQYSSLLIGGMHQAVFDDPSLTPARFHLGRSLERIIGEAIFTRNLSSNPQIATSLLDGLVGTAYHFSSNGMTAAVVSVLNLSWMTLSMHTQLFLPTAQVFLSAYHLIIAPPSQRPLWTSRIKEGLENCADLPRPFPALLMASLAAAYDGLLFNDENTVLHHTSLLETLLAPTTLSDAPMIERSPETLTRPLQPSNGQLISEFSPAQSFYLEPRYHHSEEYTDPTSDETAPPPSWVLSPSPGVSLYSMPSAAWNLKSAVLHFGEKGFNAPGENLKSIYRISLFLIRAEASLALQDYEQCMHWVDEAEALLLSIPLDYMFQRVFLMKNVIKTTCPFPCGERSVVDEFERRLLDHDIARSGNPHRDRSSIGVLWRTP